MKEILKYLSNNKLQRFDKDELIFAEDEICDAVGFVYKGSVKITSFLENGKEIVYNSLYPGDIFGANLIFSSDPHFRGDVICIEKSEIYLLSKTELTNLLMSNIEFLNLFLNIQSDFSKNLNMKIKLLTFNNAEDRLMYYIKLNNGKIQFKSIASLANELFLTRESLSRLLHDLDKQKKIKLLKKSVVEL